MLLYNAFIMQLNAINSYNNQDDLISTFVVFVLQIEQLKIF